MASDRPNTPSTIGACLKRLHRRKLTPLDFLPREELPEKLIELALHGTPPGLENTVAADLDELASMLARHTSDRVRIVVIGGGTGLSNILGGDSRAPGWEEAPFRGIKETFAQTSAIVCVTDDGGSTGELLKDFPLIGLGDLRHVLVSAIQEKNLKTRYSLGETEIKLVAATLHAIFNLRFSTPPGSREELLDQSGISLDSLPPALSTYITILLDTLFTDQEFSSSLQRHHCLGNLILASAIKHAETGGVTKEECPIIQGINELGRMIGACPVLPVTSTPARLQVLYSNGVLVTGEYKSGNAQRGFPVDRVFVKFAAAPLVPKQVLNTLQQADIIVFAPGSLYTSTIPILQVPDVADAIRRNKKALKMLVANLWVQKGETDLVRDDPKRRFHVSDLIKAYHRNIPGGVRDLFHCILTLGFRDIPGSILQNYAMEGKVPIYLDRQRVRDLGFAVVEAGIFSQTALHERRIIQHDPEGLALAVKTLWAIRNQIPTSIENWTESRLPANTPPGAWVSDFEECSSSERFSAFAHRIRSWQVRGDTPLPETQLLETMLEILWRHWDIRISHLDNVRGVHLIDAAAWSRCQQWDNVLSFFDPIDGMIKIRRDIITDSGRFEVVFLVALGQSLLGDYAEEKKMEEINGQGAFLGKVYHLHVRPAGTYASFLNQNELDWYLGLVRMVRSRTRENHYTRLINGNEGFTPPGLLFGLTYAWYLDNRFAAHIEYKMGVLRTPISTLIPEQVKMSSRRQDLIDFFRQVVFRHQSSRYDRRLS